MVTQTFPIPTKLLKRVSAAEKRRFYDTGAKREPLALTVIAARPTISLK